MEYSEEGQGRQGLVLPETELFDPAAHTVHSSKPAAVLYVPAEQGMHEGEFIPPLSFPASHHPDWKVSSAVVFVAVKSRLNSSLVGTAGTMVRGVLTDNRPEDSATA